MDQNEIPFCASDFGADFVWGTATSAYQIEGAWNHDGKLPSVWDTFAHKPRKIKKTENGDTACDSYYRYEEDINLVKAMSMKAYRFSLSWGRIMAEIPTKGNSTKVNLRGIDYYNRLIDLLLENNIKPFITLYHWDLPQYLEDRGGWTNRDVCHWLSEFAEVSVRNFGDRVKDWIVLNEPMVFLSLGYLLGLHAPGKRRLKKFLAATHHALLAQASAARAMISIYSDLKIGTTISTDTSYAWRDNNRDQVAALRYDAFMNRLYVDPVFGEGYPLKELPVLRKLDQWIKQDDLSDIQYPFDFLGVNNYTSHKVKHSFWVPWLKARPKPIDRKSERTAMNWEIHPEGLYHQLMKFNHYKKIPELYVTENGIALHDQLHDGEVHDTKRIEFFQQYLAAVLKAKRDGANVKGYFAWSLLDNFEWAEGYHSRFGLAFVDFFTGERTLKASGYWWRDFLNKN